MLSVYSAHFNVCTFDGCVEKVMVGTKAVGLNWRMQNYISQRLITLHYYYRMRNTKSFRFGEPSHTVGLRH